jgi:uncharacterized protein YndB with AHSA1/START domain
LVIKKIVLTVGGLLVLAVGLVLALAAAKPDVFEVRRSASIKAPPEKIYPLISDLRAFNSWSPYEKKDPAMKRTYSGAQSGKGAVYEWDGDSQVGAGRIAIADTTPPSNVSLELDMFKPFEAHNLVDFTLEPQGDQTKVTWAMRGKTPFMAKIVHVFLNMDRMVGDDFAAGLTNLKAIVEK